MGTCEVIRWKAPVRTCNWNVNESWKEIERRKGTFLSSFPKKLSILSWKGMFQLVGFFISNEAGLPKSILLLISLENLLIKWTSIRERLLSQVGRSDCSHLVVQDSNTGYATSSRICGLLSYLSGLFFRVCTGSQLVSNSPWPG